MEYKWNLKIPEKGKYDIMALGALVTRDDPGDVPFREAMVFHKHVSGAEYNLAANAARYGLRTAVLTAMADYCVRDLIMERVRTVGVDILGPTFSHTPWGSHHATVYSGTPRGCATNRIDYNRSNESALVVKPGMFNYDRIFEGGVRWVHCGGLYAALGPDAQALMIEFFKEGKKRGAVGSLDLNFRGKLVECDRDRIDVVSGGEYLNMDEFYRVYRRDTQQTGDKKSKFIETMKEIVRSVDVLFTNETDMINALGLNPSVTSEDPIDPEVAINVQQQAMQTFGNLEIVVTTLRGEINNDAHRWGAVATIRGEKEPYRVPPKGPEQIAVLDRIGGGDGLAGGFVTGVFKGLSPKEALYAGWASGALVASVHGDITGSTWQDVLDVTKGSAKKVQR